MQIITAAQAAQKIAPHSSILAGGFLGCGSAASCFDALANSAAHDLTLICNDTAYADISYGKLIAARRVRRVITSHIGMNKATTAQMNAGELEVELVPQGTLIERIRAGGAGLGGVLVQTGLGTLAAQGKRVVEVGGREWLLETPLRADVAVIYATCADSFGNLAYEGTTQNCNLVMALAADVVIVEVERFVGGALDPNQIKLPSVVVDFVVVRGR